MNNDPIINTEDSDGLKLLSKEDAQSEFGEAIASTISTDKAVSWAKFILTDDKPNRNRQRVPFEEFENIIRTGAFKPVKMALGEIKDGHEDAKPLGVITNLKIEGNKIIALAALWDEEREDDIFNIKERFQSNKPVNVSWEILYSKSRIQNGISDLLGVVLKAVTIVGIPAYAGRTQLIAVAATKWSPAYIEALPDTAFLYKHENGTRYFPYRDDTGKIDVSRLPEILEEISQTPLDQSIQENIQHQVKKLSSVIEADANIQELLMEEDSTLEEDKLNTEELQAKIDALASQLAVASDKLATKEAELAEANNQAELANEKVETLEQEIAPLRDFKAEADEAAQRVEKLSAVKAKFEGQGLEKSDEWFDENADKLLILDENGLDFMLQEMVAFKDQEQVQESTEASVRVPNVQGKGGKNLSITELAKALRARNK